MFYGKYKQVQYAMSPHTAWVRMKDIIPPFKASIRRLKDVEDITDDTEILLQGPLSAQDELYSFGESITQERPEYQ